MSEKTNLQRERTEINNRVREIQKDLSCIKAELGDRAIRGSRRVNLHKQQQTLMEEMTTLQTRSSDYKTQMIALEDAEFESKDWGQGGLLSEIVDLRDKYEVFAADPTRVSSMRRMASEFAVSLTKIIKPSRMEVRPE